MTAQIAPDAAQIDRFVRGVFRYASGGVVSLRAFEDTGDGAVFTIQSVPLNGSLEHLVERAIDVAGACASASEAVVFCPPLATFTQSNTASEATLHEGLTLSVECDQYPAGALAKLSAILGPPTFTVASGGEWTNLETGEIERKLHLHWRLKEPSSTPDEHRRLKRARGLACELVRADATSKTSVHPMRWPGSVHRKGTPRLAEIVDETDTEIDLNTALDELEGISAQRGIRADSAEATAGNGSRTLDIATLLACAERIANGADTDWAAWNRIGMAFFRGSGGSEAGAKAFDQYSRQHPKYDAEITKARWAHYGNHPPTVIGAGTLIYEARRSDPDFLKPKGDVTAPADFDALLAATATDPGVPFRPDALEQLAALRRTDRASFESFRAELKKVGCRVGQLDSALGELIGQDRPQRPTQADVLIGLSGRAALFHTADFTGYADIEINGHRETWPIRSKGFKRYLTKLYLEQTGSAPNAEAIQTALGTLEAKAHFDTPEPRRIHTRVAIADGAVDLDLGTDRWTAVRTVADGWHIIDRPHARFRRATGVQPLPTPERGGSIALLRPFLNVDDDTFVLIVAWLLVALRGRGPYPVLAVKGEQGSAKSTTCRLLRSVIDPNIAALRTIPRDEADLVIAANNSHVLAFDNVSGLPPWVSDALCRISTGAGLGKRELYSDMDETILDACRPVMLNGIEDTANRSDLADRAIVVALEPITETARREEEELWSAFEAARPRILGALLDAVAHGLRKFPDTKLARKPRMADFARWAVACEGAHATPGTFERVYSANRDIAAEEVVDADAVATLIRSEIELRTVWTVTSTSLLEFLSQTGSEGAKKQKGWPGTPRAVSGHVRRVAPTLRRLGIGVAFTRADDRARTRTITFSRTEGWGEQPSAPSASSAQVGFLDDGRE